MMREWATAGAVARAARGRRAWIGTLIAVLAVCVQIGGAVLVMRQHAVPLREAALCGRPGDEPAPAGPKPIGPVQGHDCAPCILCALPQIAGGAGAPPSLPPPRLAAAALPGLADRAGWQPGPDRTAQPRAPPRG